MYTLKTQLANLCTPFYLCTLYLLIKNHLCYWKGIKNSIMCKSFHGDTFGSEIKGIPGPNGSSTGSFICPNNIGDINI